MSKTMYMFDDVNVSLMPTNAEAYAGYVDGRFANFTTLARMFPHAHLLSITVFGNKAECADVETGDMTNASVYEWFKAMQKAGVWRPCIYTSASNMKAMQETMKANGFPRSSYRLWSAHYNGQAHFCAPNTCGYGLDQADATQFTDRALGRSLDESIVADDFFGPVAPHAQNPVSGLKAVAGWTGVTLTWDDDKLARAYAVKVYRKDRLLNRYRGLSTTTSSIRVGRLFPGFWYRFRIRAEPGGSTGSDASISVRTK